MEKTKNNIKKIIIAIIVCIIIITIGIFITFKTKNNESSNNTTIQNETDPRTEYIKEPTITGTPGTSMPIVDDIPTNE